MATNIVYIVSDDDGPMAVFIQESNAISYVQEILNDMKVQYEQIDSYNWRYGDKFRSEIWVDKMVIQDLPTLTK
jgi:hypothetical protein